MLGNNAEADKITVHERDVYIAGNRFTNQGYPIACYWKNGERTDLTDGSYDAIAYGIGIRESDIIVTGLFMTNYHQERACYWINGTRRSLTTSGDAGATDIFISGDKAYISGYHLPNTNDFVGKAVYWRVVGQNKTQINLSKAANSGAEVWAIYVDGSDIYAAGYQNTVNVGNRATYWKNGNRVELDDGTDLYEITEVHDIGVKDGQVFAVGYISKTDDPYYWGVANLSACYWLDGKRYVLSGDSEFAEARAIFIP